MKRGQIWTVAGGGGYATMPRPALVLQDDRFDATQSVTVCIFTTNATEAPLFRLPVELTIENSLRIACHIMIDKISTIPKARLGRMIGRLLDEDIVRVNRAVVVFLGLAAPSQRE